MKLFIPELGTKLKLTQPLLVNIEWEGRNLSLIGFINADFLKTYKEMESEYYQSHSLSWQDGLKAVGADGFQYKISDFLDDPKNKSVCNKAIQWIDSQRTIAYQKWKAFKNKNPIRFNFKENTILEVDRIYIRKGASDFSSVTFKWRNPKTLRFWLPLSEVNKINFKLV